jgi:hypothetical protein
MRWDGNLMTGFSMPFPLAGLKVYANHLYAISDYNLASFDGSDWEKLVAVNNEGEMISVSMVPFQEKLLLSVTNEIRGLEFFTRDGTQLDSGIPFSRKHYNYISTSKEIDNTLYIGGAFYEEVVGAYSRGMVTWDGEKWGVVANGPDVIINEIQQFQDQLFVVGYFNGSDNHKIAIWQPK